MTQLLNIDWYRGPIGKQTYRDRLTRPAKDAGAAPRVMGAVSGAGRPDQNFPRKAGIESPLPRPVNLLAVAARHSPRGAASQPPPQFERRSARPSRAR